jgi:ATP-dependent exoDNAse (exonuclease V) beta subunit
LLTQRLLALLATVENPEEILAITFTRKAVAEMRERVLDALIEASVGASDSVPEHRRFTLGLAQDVLKRDAEFGWALLENPGRLRIFTFDAFSAWLVAQMPVSSRFGGRASLSEDPQSLYEAAVDDLLFSLDTDDAVAEDLALVLQSLDCKLEQLHGLLADLLGRRDQWRAVFANLHGDDQAQQLLEAFLRQSVARLLEQLSARLALRASELCDFLDFAAANLCAENPEHSWSAMQGITELPTADIEALPLWQHIAELLLTKDGKFRKTVNKKNGFPPKSQKPVPRLLAQDFKEFVAGLEHDGELLKLLQELQRIPANGYGAENFAYLEALVNVLRHLLARLELVFQQTQEVDFSAVSLQALSALGSFDEASELALRLDYQVKHILVDEFQDTSTLQFDLLTLLTREWAGSGKTLFVVGDAMQSIYAFRNARVGLFMAARRYGIGEVALQELALRSNFRSAPAVVDWVNTRFQQIFPADDDLRLGAARFVEAVAARPESADASVCAYRYDASDGRDAEAQKICQVLQESKTGSRAILLRNRAQARHIIPALREAGIPWQALELDRLSDQPVVIDLMSLTRVLLNPADRVAWLSVLRSPLLGLDLAALHQVARHAPYSFQSLLLEEARWLQLPQALREELAAFRTYMQHVWDQRDRKPLPNVLQGLWRVLGGDAHYNSVMERDCAQRYLQQLRQLDRQDHALDWQVLQVAVDQLYADASNPDPAAVEILTIHKSKGLEFDTVILPSLDAASRGDEKELLSWFDPIEADGSASLLLGINNDESAAVSMYAYVRYLKAQQQLLETRRLLYVACTRAAKNLHLFAGYKLDKNSEPAMPAEKSLAGALWPSTEAGIEAFLALEDLQQTPRLAASMIPKLTRAAQVSSKDDLLRAYRGEEVDDDSRPEEQQYLFERHVGTVVHRNLQTLAEQGLAAWRLRDPSSLQALWRVQLRQLGLQGTLLDEGVIWVQRAMSATIADESVHWLFSNEYAESLTEHGVSIATRSGARHYVIDRSLLDAEGCRWIIDYKTLLQADEDEQVMLLNLQESYAAQLQTYRQAYTLRGEKTIRTALYLPLQQKLLELDESGRLSLIRHCPA